MKIKKYSHLLIVGIFLSNFLITPCYARATPFFKGEVDFSKNKFQLTLYTPSRAKRRAHEFKGQFAVKDKRLYLKTLVVDRMSGHGFIDLAFPCHVDLEMELTAMDLNDFLDFFVPRRDYESAGEVSGTVELSGTMSRLFLKGKLQSHGGFVKDLSFESMDVNVDGVYPHLNIHQSSLTKRNGLTYLFEGPFDLSDRDHYKSQLTQLTFSPLVTETDFDREWTFKRSEDENSRMEIKYLLRRKNVPGTLPSENDVGMVGIEQGMKF